MSDFLKAVKETLSESGEVLQAVVAGLFSKTFWNVMAHAAFLLIPYLGLAYFAYSSSSWLWYIPAGLWLPFVMVIFVKEFEIKEKKKP